MTEAAQLLYSKLESKAKNAIYSGLYKSLIQYIDITHLVSPARRPPGKEVLRVFTDSLSKLGFLRPILIDGEGRIADGAKRFCASRILGLTIVPCVTSPTPLIFEDDLLIRRLQTDELSFFEYAEVLKDLTARHLYSQESVSFAIGRSQSFVANKLRLLSFSPEERRIIEEGNLCERHCRAALRIADPQRRLDALKYISSAGLNVCAAEEYVSSLLPNRRSRTGEFLLKLDSLLRAYSDSDEILCEETTEYYGSVTYRITVSKNVSRETN